MYALSELLHVYTTSLPPPTESLYGTLKMGNFKRKNSFGVCCRAGEKTNR